MIPLLKVNVKKNVQKKSPEKKGQEGEKNLDTIQEECYNTGELRTESFFVVY